MSTTPHTADLAARYLSREAEVYQWFLDEQDGLALPPYSSVDLRDAGFKVAPVDLNLFPSGFNNLTERYLEAAGAVWRAQLDVTCPGAQSVCIIPESHTRNTFYLQNVTSLVRMLRDAGYAPVVATVDPIFVNPVTELEAADGTPLTIHKAAREGDRLVVQGEAPDVILLNNDLADGPPAELRDLAQPVLPPVEVGWFSRRKGAHSRHYTHYAAQWARVMDVEPWLVTPQTEEVEDVDFHEPDTFGALADAVDRVIEHTRAKYAEYGIDQTPVCFIKDDAGTYGMGIVTAASGDDVRHLNRKQRNKMDRGKGNAIISRVIVQEGIPTALQVDGHSAEPVLYMVGGQVIGGFRRYHGKRGGLDNLNARGAKFTDLCPPNQPNACLDENPVFRLYGALARIALLAGACEIRDLAGHAASRV